MSLVKSASWRVVWLSVVFALFDLLGWCTWRPQLGCAWGFEFNHNKHARNTDKPIAGLLKDLKRRGLLDETIVVWGGEFGRQPTAEYSVGSDVITIQVVYDVACGRWN